MITRFVEASTPGNWGKFLVGAPTEEEWKVHSAVDVTSRRSLLAGRGWSRLHLIVFDVETGEGAFFLHGALGGLAKHQIWVCPAFEHFLAWLNAQPMPKDEEGVADPEGFVKGLPRHVELPDAPSAFRGYRRGGPDDETRADPAGTRMALGAAPTLRELTT